MDKAKINDMCLAWHELCRINRRIFALQSVTEFFGLADHTAAVRAKYGRVGYMRGDIFTDLLAAEKSILADIRVLFGESIYNSVYNSLK